MNSNSLNQEKQKIKNDFLKTYENFTNKQSFEKILLESFTTTFTKNDCTK